VLRLKVLKGAQAGMSLPLKVGDNVVGRAPQCDVVINANGVSKQHAKITVQGDKCIITDLGSSNGTFVNGAKIKDRIVKIGDRIAFHDVIVELASGQAHRPQPHVTMPQNLPEQHWGTNLAYQQQVQAPPGLPGPTPLMGQSAPSADPKSFVDIFVAYLHKVILPGIYRINEIYPTKTILAVFIGAFVILVTMLATIPMAQLTKEGVQKEAQRRALTIARQLAGVSERAIAAGSEVAIRTDFAEAEDGVTMALVVSREDGHIIAPLTKAQSYSTDEFVARGRKHDEIFIDQINSSTVGVSVPVKSFSAEAGQQITVAYAQVIYKMNSLDFSATIALFARVLIIASLLGGILYFLLYQVLVEPLRDATKQLDQALRGERQSLTTKYDFDVFKHFLEYVNSAVTRMGDSDQNKKPSTPIDRGSEASNLVRIVSDPAFALDANGNFLQVNSAFEEKTSMRLLTLQGQGLDALQDQALKLNLEDLVARARSQPGSIISSQLDISGISHEIDVQASAEEDGIAYIIGTIKTRGSQ
jgi:PAS domain-containing protein